MSGISHAKRKTAGLMMFMKTPDPRSKFGFTFIELNMPLTCVGGPHHGQGNMGLADGSVFQVSDKLLKEKLVESGNETYRMEFP
ncbi:MAG TPA: hypothetical protein VHH88_01690 [Verrucomicrobiae bacterium]|nr:hypothetical protein [Verrucomicrobiae bacterium]